MVKFLLKYQYLIFFLVVLVFRLSYASGVVNFTQDQARDVVLMEKFRQEKTVFVGYGPKASVANFYLAPFYYQLHYSLSFVTNNHPLTMHFFTVLVESLTPLLLFLILKRFFDKQTAFVSALLFAFSPLVTIFSTFAWNPNMIPFLSTASLYLFLRYDHERKWWQISLGILFVAMAIHLHYQAVVLIPFLVVYFLINLRKKYFLIHFLIATFLSVITILPYFWIEIQNNWVNTKAIINFFTTEHARYYDRVSKPEFVLTFIPQFFERIFFKESYGWMKVVIGRVVLLLGLSLLAIKSIKLKKLRFVLVYFLLILLMMRVYKGDKLDYYMSTLFIMPYFLLALLINFKKIFLLFAIVIAWLAGGQYALLRPSNQLEELKTAINFIDSNLPQKSVKFIFHDDNYLNIFSYGVKQFSSLAPDKNANLIVDVCYGLQSCDWDGRKWCAEDRGYTYMALFREASEYTQLARYVTPTAYRITLGIVDVLPTINYEISQYDSQYGSDILNSEW